MRSRRLVTASLQCHGSRRAESAARTTALASGDLQPRQVPAHLRGVGWSVVGSAFDDEATAGTSAVRGVVLASGPGGPVTGSGCGSPRAVSTPSSGQGVGDACADSRGGPALPTSPSAGLRPIRRRPSRPSSDRASMLGRSGGLANQQTQLPERRPSARSSRTASTARQPERGQE